MSILIIYIIFYVLTFISIMISGIISFFFGYIGLMLIRVDCNQGEWNVLLLFFVIPIFIFLFQLFQDLNYRIIHMMGYWGHKKPKFSRRGLTIPDFYKQKTINNKSKYRFRLIAIFQWVQATICSEVIIFIYWYLNHNVNVIIFFILFFIGGCISLFISNKLIEKLGLKVAYIESGREFYYRNNIS